MRSSRNDTAARGGRATLLAAGFAAILWLAMLLLGGSGLDRTLLVSGYAGQRPLGDAAAILTRFGDWEVLVGASFFAAAWLIWRRRARDAAFLLLVTMAGRLLVALQKIVFARVRPEENNHLVEVTTLSFPSGHAANSMVVWTMMALMLVEDPERRRRATVAAVLLSLVVGVSRVLLGVHWPSDVVGGWSFGALWVLLCARLAQTLNRNSMTSPS